MSTGAQYVVAVYGVVLFALLVYVVVLGLRTARVGREAELLSRLVAREEAPATGEPTGREPEAGVAGAPRSAEA